MGIINQNGAMYWATGIDNSGLMQDAQETKSIIGKMSGEVKKDVSEMESSIKKVSSALAAIGGTAAIGMLGKQILDTTAKFEKFGIVLKNTLGEAEGAAALDMIAEFAATTPFQLDEVTAAFIKMANQGFVPTRSELVKLGDLASSTGKSFDQLTEALLDAQTGQFERLKEFGIKASAQGDKVTFSFKEQQTTVDNTNSAIQAYMLSLGDLQGVTGANAKISESLTGQLSNLQDKLEAMYNTIGTSNSGILYAAVGGVSTLIENYETVGKVLIGLVAVYGSYKAGVLIAVAANNLAISSAKGYTAAQMLQYNALLLTEKAQALLNKTMLSNPYVAATMLVMGLVGAMTLYASSTKDVRTEKEILNDLEKESQKNTKQQVTQLELLKKILNDSNKSYGERKIALDKLKEIVPDYNASLTEEGILINNNSDALDTYVKKLVIAEKIKAAAAGQSRADEAFNNYKTDNNDVIKTAVKKKMNGEELFAGEAGALETWTKLAKEASNYGKVIEQLQTELISIDAKNTESGVSETPAQKKARLLAEKKAKAALDKINKSIESGEYNANQDLEKLLVDLQNQTANILIKNSEDNLQNRLAQIELEKQAEIQKITDKEIAIIDAYNKAHEGDKHFKSLSTESGSMKASINTIDPDLGKQLETEELNLIKAYGQKKAEATKVWGEELLDLAREFADKRVQIAYDYNEKIKKLQEDGMVEDANNAIKERDKAVSEATASLIEQTELYKILSDEKLLISKNTTEALLDDLRQRLADEWAAGKLSVDQMNKFMDQINEAQEKVSSKKIENNPFAMLGSAIKGQKKAKTDYNSALSDPSKSATEFSKLESAANAATKATAMAVAASLAGVQDILQSVVGGLNQLGVLNDQQQKDAENVIGMVGGAANLAMGIATGNPMAIIQGSIDLLVNGYELFDMRTKNANKEIANQEKAIERLKDSYEDLERAIDRAFSTTKAELINEEIANLESQNRAISRQIEAEKSKKKPDNSVLGEWRTTIDENRNKIEDLNDSIVEAITGTSVMSAIDSFAQAYADAWTTGESAAQKSADVVKGILKNTLINYMKGQLSNDVDNVMTAIKNAMLNDNKIDAAEQNAIDALTSALDTKAAEYESALSPYLDKSKSGVTGELKAEMTEGTGSQLVGLWNMTAMDIRWIREWIAAQSGLGGVSADMSKDINKILDDISAIRTNTGRTADNTDGLVDSLNSLKKEVKEELTQIKNNTKSNKSRL